MVACADPACAAGHLSVSAHRGHTWSVGIGAGLALLAANAHAFDFFQPLTPPRPFQVMGHRGAAGQAPENTRAALERAIDDQLEWAEVDVRLTRDGRHVVCHDAMVGGKTDGHGRVEELSLAAIQALDAGSWFAPRFAGERILSLGECLALAKGRCNLYLDCKVVDALLLAREVLDAGMERQVVVYGDAELAEKVRAASRGQVPVMLEWHPADGTDAWLDKVHPDAVEIDADEVSARACRWFHDRGITVQAKVLGDDDRPEVWDTVIEAGADWLQTDLPEEIIAQRLWASRRERPVGIAFHRGANRYAPENTLPAFEKAIRMGADYVEIDVRRSRDGQYFIMHDGTLDRTTDGTGPLAAQDAEAIGGLDTGAWFGAPYRGVRIPTLEEALLTLRGRTGIYFDAKEISPTTLARALVEANVVEQTVVYDDEDSLRELKAANPNIRLLCPLDDPGDVDRLVDGLHPYAFDTSWEILSESLIARCHALGVKVFSDAMAHEQVDEYRKAMDWGIDVIQTDHPLRVMRAGELIGAAR